MARTSLIRRSAAIVLVSVVGCLGIVASTHAADARPVCGSPPCALELAYFTPPPSEYSSLSPTLCDYDAAHNCFIRLTGRLYLPGGVAITDSAAGLPLVVFVHGSTLTRAVPPRTEMARFFTEHGFAFFAPDRRGHGGSTGQNIDVPSCTKCGGTAQHKEVLANLEAQVLEVRESIGYLRTLSNGHGPLVDPNQVAVIGHSFGGIISLFANQYGLGQRTEIDIAGASQSWQILDRENGNLNDSSPSINILKSAVAAHVHPMMFMEPVNDCSTRPTVVLSNVIADQNEVYDATLFDPVPDVVTCRDAHIGFVRDHDQIYGWGPSALAWLQRNGVG